MVLETSDDVCSCGNLNFARRTECNKCGAPSPAGAGDHGSGGYNRGGGGGFGGNRSGRGGPYNGGSGGGGRGVPYGSQGGEDGGYGQVPPPAQASYGGTGGNITPTPNSYGGNNSFGSEPIPQNYGGGGGPNSYPPSYGVPPKSFSGDGAGDMRGGSHGGPPGGYGGGAPAGRDTGDGGYGSGAPAGRDSGSVRYGGGAAGARDGGPPRQPGGGYGSAPAEPPAKVKQCDENCDDTCDNSRIYISNLPPDVTIEELQELFGGIGLVGRIKQKRGYKDQWPWNIKIYTDEAGNNKGDAVLSYEDPSAAHSAGGFYNNHDLRGYKIGVAMAEKSAPRAPPAFGHGGGGRGGYGGGGGDRRRDNYRDGGGSGPDRHYHGGQRSCDAMIVPGHHHPVYFMEGSKKVFNSVCHEHLAILEWRPLISTRALIVVFTLATANALKLVADAGNLPLTRQWGFQAMYCSAVHHCGIIIINRGD
ncbi:hypothetical protein ACLOJK_031621 [Asimina triloba]